jgi:hypothetical protein
MQSGLECPLACVLGEQTQPCPCCGDQHSSSTWHQHWHLLQLPADIQTNRYAHTPPTVIHTHTHKIYLPGQQGDTTIQTSHPCSPLLAQPAVTVTNINTQSTAGRLKQLATGCMTRTRYHIKPQLLLGTDLPSRMDLDLHTYPHSLHIIEGPACAHTPSHTGVPRTQCWVRPEQQIKSQPRPVVGSRIAAETVAACARLVQPPQENPHTRPANTKKSLLR